MHLLTPSDQPNPKIPKKVKDLVSLTLKLGWKNKKQPFGPTELDLEAGNLVFFHYPFKTCSKLKNQSFIICIL